MGVGVGASVNANNAQGGRGAASNALVLRGGGRRSSDGSGQSGYIEFGIGVRTPTRRRATSDTVPPVTSIRRKGL